MTTRAAWLQLIGAIQEAACWLEARGVMLPDDLAAEIGALKSRSLRRDRREPAREEKEKLEKKITALMLRRFRKQRDAAIAKLEAQHPERKAADLDILINADDWTEDDEDEFDAELVDLLTQARLGGIALFGKKTPLTIDYTLTNMEAAAAARAYAYDLVKGIDETSRDALRLAIAAFVETPGMTIGDVEKLLSSTYNEVRAEMIAVTEITRAYVQGELQAAEALHSEFPDVRIVKYWYTAADEIVCPLCGPLDGMRIGIDEQFYDPEDDPYLDGNPPRHVNCRCGFETGTLLE